MDDQRFKVPMDRAHRVWLARLFNVSGSMNGGIDLASRGPTLFEPRGTLFPTTSFALEIKARNNSRGDGSSAHFTVHGYQIEQFRRQNPRADLYFVPLLYTLDTLIKNLPENSLPAELERHVVYREAWFVPWSVVEQRVSDGTLPVHQGQTGEYVYLKRSDLPQRDYNPLFIGGNILHFHRGSLLEYKLHPTQKPRQGELFTP